MQYDSPAWIVLQAVASGVIGGLCALHLSWWRGNHRDRGAMWLFFWSLSLTVLFLLNAVVPLLASDGPQDLGLFLRSQVLAVTILLVLPVMQAVTRGPAVRSFVLACATLFAIRAVLFLTTDLVFAHRYVDGLPQYGPLVAVAFLGPLAIVCSYLVLCLVRMRADAGRAWLIVAAAACVGLLVYAFYLHSGALSEHLTGVWAVPLVAVIQVVSLQRLRATQQATIRSQRMRDAVAALTNAAWFERDPEVLLVRAESSARVLLGDPTIAGHLRRLPGGGYHTSFHADPAVIADDTAATFLDDLGHVVSSAADRHDLTRQLRTEAATDPLTRLPNRRALDERIEAVLADPDRDRVAVLFCDVDRFKSVNDEFGHPLGDAIIQLVATRLSELAGPDAYVARFGGDEFVVICQHAGPDEDVVALAERLREATAEAPDGCSRTLSIGIAVCEPDEARDAHALVRDADTAMYEAKRSRSGVRLFDADLRRRVLREIELSRDISRAVDSGEIGVQFQPIVDVATLRVVAIEALSRWSRGGEELPPEEWVPVAEEHGQITAIGLDAVRAARRASDEFGLPVAVNVAPRQLADPDLAERVVEAWGGDRLDRLTLEITESALLEDMTRAVATLERLRARGATVALDDFGTGYSSLTRLASLPIDVLKIDQAFVRDVTTERGTAVLRAVLELARAHALDVVVEGVETVEEFRVVAGLGAQKVQGFLFGRASLTAPLEVVLPAP